jgi:hypothetical protein
VHIEALPGRSINSRNFNACHSFSGSLHWDSSQCPCVSGKLRICRRVLHWLWSQHGGSAPVSRPPAEHLGVSSTSISASTMQAQSRWKSYLHPHVEPGPVQPVAATPAATGRLLPLRHLVLFSLMMRRLLTGPMSCSEVPTDARRGSVFRISECARAQCSCCSY